MHAIRQKCRPKHQVLVLKCYPRTTKGAVDIKPNSSELSYLLYYATTRRSKIQKVGGFLERKTASDVWRLRIGNVQVTLQIVEALIEKSPRDLPLYAPYVLKILGLILRSNDITMVEASIPTFEAFCEHHDGASLSADQEYLKQYVEIVRMYASFGSTRPQSSKNQPSAPVAMRWRIAGLQAIKSVARAEALGTVAGRQLDVIIPVLLENIWTDSTGYLDLLEQRAKVEEKVDSEKLLRRRTSIATVRTVETSETNPNPAAVSGTADDADKLAEEDIGVLAIQGLKHIFVVNNRAQIRGATFATLKFIEDRVSQREVLTDFSPLTGEDRGWATSVILMLTRWTPVQDRYLILVTAMEKLVRSPLTEGNLQQQLVLATIIGSLLSSDINLIGLSVMDVLLGLIQHVLRILQLGGVDPHHQQRDATAETSKQPSPTSSQSKTNLVEIVKTPSTPRKLLLARLERCIADLATHVYYADQISDMISAILLRLKPSPLSGIPNTAAAIEDPQATTSTISQSAHLNEDPNTDGFFSFATAKITALRAIRGILLVATKQAKLSGSASLSRNRVGLRVWEGTQWLLRDVDGGVRKAYVEALLVWLHEEMTRADLKAAEDKPPSPTKSNRGGDDTTGGLSKRAVSNATHREKSHKSSKTTFLQLLHLAVYENALQYVDYEADVAMLHLLLVTLVKKLGVNAVRSGLPMIFRLQEDIQEVETMAKVRIGSLCHGYFWALSEEFNFESSAVNREIQNEIVRRKSKGFWVDIIRLPAVPIEQLGTPGVVTPHPELPMHILESESLRPFDDRLAMVELICLAYTQYMATPANSPPTSPGRSFSHPILGSTQSQELAELQIPEKAREEMLQEWSKESVLAGVQSASKTVSLNGSRSGTNATGGARTFLAVNGAAPEGRLSGTESPHSHTNHRSRPPSQAYGLVGPLGPIQKLRKPFGQGDSQLAGSVSSRASVTRVDQLKRVLSGQAPPSQIGISHSDASSESMVSYEVTPSELSYDNRGASFVDANATPRNVSTEVPRSKSRDRLPSAGEHLRPLSSNPVTPTTSGPGEVEEEEKPIDSEVPPVPPVPSSLPLPGGFPSDTPPAAGAAASKNTTVQDYASAGDTVRTGRSLKRDVSSRGKLNGLSFSGAWDGERDFNVGAGQTEKPIDLETLLHNIETDSNSGAAGPGALKGINGIAVNGNNGIVVKPPY